jgi:Cys-tRNA(Pro)/Cys-tRNA(Cys) deacylase
MKTPVTEKLDKLQINYKVKLHNKPVYTSEAAAAERGVRLSQIVKTLLFIDSSDRLIIAVVPGDRRINLKKLKKALGVKKLGFVDKETVAERLALVAGAIAPVSDFFEGRPIFIDPSVFDEAVVDISSGDPCVGIELTSEDLRKILKTYEVVDITK